MEKNLIDKKTSFMYVKVGIFFLAAFFLLFIALLSMRKVDIFKENYVVTAKFDFVEGLRSSSPVRFCGVDVGQISKVVIVEEEGEPLVRVYAQIEKGVRIPKDSYFFINSLSLLGEKYLEIAPSSSLSTMYINDGDVINGISPIPLFNVFVSFNRTMKEVSEFVKEGKIKTSLEAIFLNAEDITSELKRLIIDMRDKKGTIGRLLYDDSLYQTTEEFVEDLKQNPWKLLYKPKESRRRKVN